MSRIQRPLSQQFPPSDPELKHKPVARELLVRRSTRHEPLPEKRLPTQQNMELYDRNRTAPSGVERVPGSEKNGDLPVDQLIPLEELPRSETQSPALVDDVPLLRRPKRQNKIVPSFNYNTDISICCGIILIIIGICEIVLNITAIVRHHLTGQQHVLNLVFYLAPGIWCAVFFILCGVFGVLSSRRPEVWLIVTHLVVSTLASVFAAILIALFGWAISIEVNNQENLDVLLVVLISIMLFGGLLAGILAITAGSICCQYFCRRPVEKVNYQANH